MFNLKFIGGILIVTGTCIGGGLLALPVGTAPVGFLNSLLVIFFIWLVMILGSLYILEMTQWFSCGVNIISISKSVLGKKGETVAWIIYILLCYSLVCAYISGGGDIFRYLLSVIKINVSEDLAAIIFVLILGYVVYLGVGSIDRINRWFMVIKFLVLFCLIFLIMPHIKFANLITGKERYIASAISVLMTSFGFSIVIPSLFDYFRGDVKKVQMIIIIGSLIPLICYILWMFVIMGALPHSGNGGLMDILISGKTTSGLVDSLKRNLNIHSISDLSELFVSICMFTSFLGVSLALTDLLADGLRIKKGDIGSLKICGLAFIPPLFIIIFWPEIFVIALSYAGLFVIIQQLILPVIIIWHGRYKKMMSKKYRVFGGKILLSVMFFVSIALLVVCLLGCFSFLKIAHIS